MFAAKRLYFRQKPLHQHLIFIPLLKIVYVPIPFLFMLFQQFLFDVIVLRHWSIAAPSFMKLFLIFLNYALQNYKPPTAYDIPEVMNVKMIEGNKSLGVLSSKATGEPAVHSALSVAFALRNAVMAAKMDHKLGQDWFNLGNLNSFLTTLEPGFRNYSHLRPSAHQRSLRLQGDYTF